MGLDLSKLARVARTREVALSMGREIVRVQVRGLSAAESSLIGLAFVEPVPPRKKDPNGGSLATVPDREDPQYLREISAYYSKVRAAEVAVATEMALADGRGFPADKSEQEMKLWIAEAATQVQKTFSAAEVDNMAAAMMAVSGYETLKAMAQQLVIQRTAKKEGEIETEEPTDPLELPAEWDRSEEGLMMRACKQYGQDPFTWPLTLTADQRNKVLAEQLIWDREEREKRTHLQILSRALAMGT